MRSLRGVRIAPDGETGKAVGQFSLRKLTASGYASKGTIQAAACKKTQRVLLGDTLCFN